ncbi:TIGR01244 family sulfur transferase [Rhodanobacter sp. AS-Z3]|uniref:TIGR01244 family sulfur transferase n=1 Tax=Rhodanobacter sp. AS-Z3 TaxID=3031330 RepID=UPI0024784E6B|nr:TIGR01244 family sulfur transferase [Rhodanobacter sp. AS-Z3]WEN15667.1 TIGR01244 family sulfur transferase [Rhodanobacter sp. AS-Z3]
MQIHPLVDQLSVAPQIEVADMTVLAAQGFRGVINNRPDDEEPGQPSNRELEQAAQQAGLGWRYIPVTPGQFTEQQAHGFSQALSELPGPVLAFCRSGTRSSSLWALQAEGSVDAILDTARVAGYDLSMLRPLLERKHGA